MDRLIAGSWTGSLPVMDRLTAGRTYAAAVGGIMKVAVVAETDAGEPRVAAVPETIKKMIGLGAEVAVEPGEIGRAHV